LRRWRVVTVVAVAAAILIAVAAVWAMRGPDPATNGNDCALVEDVARQWEVAQADVQRILEQGSGQPDRNLDAAARQSAMGEVLRRAANSAASEDVASQLNRWADGAEQFAQIERDAANRVPDDPAAPNDSQYVSAATNANDASIALARICPDMPSGHS
jgi:hypothetical protein